MDVFSNGVFRGQTESQMRDQYKSYKQSLPKQKNASQSKTVEVHSLDFLSYCSLTAGVELPEYIVGRKTIKLPPLSAWPQDTIDFIKQSKTHMSTAEYVTSKINKMDKVLKGSNVRSSLQPLSYSGTVEHMAEQ
jgi:hypothetical protein